MNEAWSERNSEFINEFVDLLLRRKSSGKERFVVFAGAAISIHPPSCLPAAKPMLEATIRLLLEDEVLGTTLCKGNVFDELSSFIRDALSEDPRRIPPEMIYDAIYEFAGKKVFRALGCLKSDRPNANHRILAKLLDEGYIDNIVTTNFDCLIEHSLPKRFPLLPSPVRDHIWHIHGNIDTPSSIATTLHRIGRAAFDKKLLDRLTTLLEGSHVLFIGYSGADPDLMPAFMQVRMASVFWCVWHDREIEVKRESPPWENIQARTEIRWIVGDLYDELLCPIALKLRIQSEEKIPDCKDTESPLDESMKRWEQDETERLSPDEKARIILKILYDIARYSSKSKPAEIWELLIRTASALAEEPALSNCWYSEFRRDLHVFQAEANLYLAAGDEDRARDYLVRAKDHLTTVLPLHKTDAVQVQALLDGGAILVDLASSRDREGKERNLRVAETMFKEGLEICSQTQMASEKRKVLEARCYSNLAGLYSEGNKHESLNLLDRAEKLFRESGDLYSYVVTCINISQLYIEMGKIAEAKRYCDKAERYLSTVPNEVVKGEMAALKRNVARMLINQGVAFAESGHPKEALRCFQQALEVQRAKGDLAGESDVLHAIGSLHLSTGQAITAAEFYQEALEVLQRAPNPDKQHVAILVNDIGAANVAAGNYRIGLEYYEKALAIHRETGNRNEAGVTLHAMAGTYELLGEKEKALYHYRQALELFKEVGNQQWIDRTEQDIRSIIS